MVIYLAIIIKENSIIPIVISPVKSTLVNSTLLPSTIVSNKKILPDIIKIPIKS
jgi:hypothetical protein